MTTMMAITATTTDAETHAPYFQSRGPNQPRTQAGTSWVGVSLSCFALETRTCGISVMDNFRLVAAPYPQTGQLPSFLFSGDSQSGQLGAAFGLPRFDAVDIAGAPRRQEELQPKRHQSSFKTA